MLDTMKLSIQRGLRPGGIWKPEALTDILVAFKNAGYPPLLPSQARSKREALKSEWKQVEYLLSLDGFGIDPESGRIVADDETWKNLLDRGISYAKWRTKTMPASMKADLDAIFKGTSATEAYSQTEQPSQDTHASVTEELDYDSQSAPETQVPVSPQSESQFPINPQLGDTISPLTGTSWVSPSQSPSPLRLSDPFSQRTSSRSSISQGRKRKRKQQSIVEALYEIIALHKESLQFRLTREKKHSSDRKMAVLMILELAKEEGWEDKRFDCALDLLRNDIYVDTIIMLPIEKRKSWLIWKTTEQIRGEKTDG